MDQLGAQELDEQSLAFFQQEVQNGNGFIFDENAAANLTMVTQNGCSGIDQNGAENKSNFVEK